MTAAELHLTFKLLARRRRISMLEMKPDACFTRGFRETRGRPTETEREGETDIGLLILQQSEAEEEVLDASRVPTRVWFSIYIAY